MNYIRKVLVFTDAACRKNPGSASIGVIVKDENGKLLQKFSKRIGNSTNNRAEYFAVLKGLELALKFSRDEVNVFTDSKLVVKQLNAEYRIKNKKLLEIVKQIKVTELLFKKVRYFYVSEKRNKDAHKLAKMVLR
jgi:ribonuclease HI